jgi:hypothetical protein
MAFEQRIVLSGLIVVLGIVTVVLLATHYRNVNVQRDTFVDQPFDPNYSNDVSSTQAQIPEQDVIRPYDESERNQDSRLAARPAGDESSWTASDGTGDEVYRTVDYPVNAPATANPGCFPRDKLSAEDLLPKDAANSMWSQVMPAGQGDLSDKNFLTAGYHVGMSSSVMRNANYGIRSEPPNPQMVVSPWMNTTIDPDVMRRPLEVETAVSCS